MQYLHALEKILNGMSNDNAAEIESGAQMLIALVGDVPITGAERKLAAHLTKRAVDLPNEFRKPSWCDDGLDDAVIGSLP